MAEREFEKLEEALVRAGKAMTYPPTPALSTRVHEQLAAQPVPRGRHWLSGWSRPARLAFALAAAFVLAIGLLLAFPDARDALAQLLGLRTVRIFFVTPTPTPLLPSPTRRGAGGEVPTPTATPAPGALCCETTLADAQQRAGFKILLPPSETPSRIYFSEFAEIPGAQQVILLFGDPPAPRFTLFEAQSVIYGKAIFLYGKVVDQGTTLAETTVNGQRALWLSGAPHVLVRLDANGTPVPGVERTVNANTLAWEKDNVTYRLETTASEAEAVQFAESLR